jgi:hypothetical protein
MRAAALDALKHRFIPNNNDLSGNSRKLSSRRKPGTTRLQLDAGKRVPAFEPVKDLQFPAIPWIAARGGRLYRENGGARRRRAVGFAAWPG